MSINTGPGAPGGRYEGFSMVSTSSAWVILVVPFRDRHGHATVASARHRYQQFLTYVLMHTNGVESISASAVSSGLVAPGAGVTKRHQRDPAYGHSLAPRDRRPARGAPVWLVGRRVRHAGMIAPPG
jgi:hypothetical protein